MCSVYWHMLACRYTDISLYLKVVFIIGKPQPNFIAMAEKKKRIKEVNCSSVVQRNVQYKLLRTTKIVLASKEHSQQMTRVVQKRGFLLSHLLISPLSISPKNLTGNYIQR